MDYLVPTVVTANNTPFICKICLLRNDTWSKEVKFRVESVLSDLHAAGARYHQECKTNFFHSSYLDRLAKTSDNDIDIALPRIIKLMKANEKEMWKSEEVHNIYTENGEYRLNRRNLAKALKNHFGDSLVIFSSPGEVSILTIRKSCHFRLQNSNDIDDKNVKEFAERSKLKLRKKIGRFTKFNL